MSKQQAGKTSAVVAGKNPVNEDAFAWVNGGRSFDEATAQLIQGQINLRREISFLRLEIEQARKGQLLEIAKSFVVGSAQSIIQNFNRLERFLFNKSRTIPDGWLLVIGFSSAAYLGAVAMYCFLALKKR